MVPKAAFWQCPETLFDILKTLFYEGAFSKFSTTKNVRKISTELKATVDSSIARVNNVDNH
jgi:hypothetical protein